MAEHQAVAPTMQGQVVAEDNSRRKFHRVSLTLKLEFKGQLYSVKDWSVGGVGIESFDPDVQIGDVVNVRVVLPMPDSQLFVQMPVRICNVRGYVTGCEFHNLNPRQKRILRHYVEMAVEGQLQSVDDMIAITTAPVIASPIDEALTFTELEKNAIEKNFRKKSIVTIAMAVAVAAVFILSIIYVTVFRIERVGVAVGSLEGVTSTGEGVVTVAHHIPVGSYVDKGEVLLELDSTEVKSRLAELDAQLAAFENQTGGGISDTSAQNRRLLSELGRRVNSRYKEYLNAKRLYDEQLIHKADLSRIEDKLFDARQAFEKEKIRLMGTRVVGLDKASIAQERAVLEQMRASLLNQLNLLSVKAPAAGKLVSVNYDEGLYVQRQDVIAVIDRDVEPVVSMKLLSEDALRLTIGMPVRIYAPVLGDYFDGHVTDIGYAAFKADSTVTEEVKQGETLIRIAFDDTSVRLPPNSRVKVWIRTFKWPWE